MLSLLFSRRQVTLSGRKEIAEALLLSRSVCLMDISSLVKKKKGNEKTIHTGYNKNKVVSARH